jgi:uncharacterized protein (DUF1697 family)
MRWAAFLRAINVAGRRVTNEELRACFEAMGFQDVRTFRASGNVVFASASEPRAAVTARISEQLAAALGYHVAMFLRTADEVRAIARLRPFAAAQLEASAGRLQVALLSRRPSARVRDSVLALATPSDRLVIGERELYWLPSGNMSDSSLQLKAVEALLGGMTMRTKNTIEQIAGRHFAD